MTRSLLELSFVREPGRFPVPAGLDTRGLDIYTPFVDAVSRHADVAIPRINGFLRDVAPPDGFILFVGSAEVSLEECAPERRASLAARMVPLRVPGSRVCEWLESFSVPAAVTEIGSWLTDSWQSADERPPGAWGLYGIRDIGARIGALVGPGPALFHSARYNYLASPTHEDLPHLLVDYLTAYQEVAATGVDPRTLSTVPPAR